MEMKRGIQLVTALALASCQFNCNSFTEAGDAAPNAPDAPAGCSGWGYAPLHFDPCLIQQPTGSLSLLVAGGTYTYNTDDGTLSGPGVTAPATEVLLLNPPVRVIIV